MRRAPRCLRPMLVVPPLHASARLSVRVSAGKAPAAARLCSAPRPDSARRPAGVLWREAARMVHAERPPPTGRAQAAAGH